MLTEDQLNVLSKFIPSDRERQALDLLDSTGLDTGALYTILYGLEVREYLTSRWAAASQTGLRRHRVYQITSAGQNAVSETRANLKSRL